MTLLELPRFSQKCTKSNRSPCRKIDTPDLKFVSVVALSPEPLIVNALRPHVRRENALPKSYRLWRHFDQLIVVDELDRLFEAELARRNQADGLVGGRCA